MKITVETNLIPFLGNDANLILSYLLMIYESKNLDYDRHTTTLHNADMMDMLSITETAYIEAVDKLCTLGLIDITYINNGSLIFDLNITSLISFYKLNNI